MAKSSVLAAFVAVVLVAPPAGAETIKEAVAKAYQNNPTLLAARARLRAVDEGVPEALSGWRPTVSLNYDIGKEHSTSTGGTTGRRSQNTTPRTGSITLDQNLFQGGSTRYSTLRAEHDVMAERARLASTEQQIMFDAGTAYVDVLRDEAVLRLNQNNERVLQRQLEATRDRFQVGEVTRTDVAQAESRLSRATADRILAEGDLARSRAAYRDVIGDFPGTLSPAQALGDLPPDRDDAIKQASVNSPDVIASWFDEKSAEAGVKVVTSELFPTVDLEGEASRSNDTASTDSRSDSQAVTARFSMPLYQAGGVSARIRAAKQSHSQRRQELDASIRSAISLAISAWEDYQTSVAQIKALRSEVNAASIALEGVRQEAQVGSRTVLDVLDAEQELLNARVSLVRAQRDEVVASLDLRRRIGTLQASHLDLKVPTYDFTAYYKKVRYKWYGWGIGDK